MLKRFLVTFMAVALLVLPGCAQLGPVGDVFKDAGSQIKAGSERIFESFDVDVEADKDGATVALAGVGVEGSLGVNWRQWGCILIGFAVESLCDEPDPE